MRVLKDFYGAGNFFLFESYIYIACVTLCRLRDPCVFYTRGAAIGELLILTNERTNGAADYRELPPTND